MRINGTITKKNALIFNQILCKRKYKESSLENFCMDIKA